MNDLKEKLQQVNALLETRSQSPAEKLRALALCTGLMAEFSELETVPDEVWNVVSGRGRALAMLGMCAAIVGGMQSDK